MCTVDNVIIDMYLIFVLLYLFDVLYLFVSISIAFVQHRESNQPLVVEREVLPNAIDHFPTDPKSVLIEFKY